MAKRKRVQPVQAMSKAVGKPPASLPEGRQWFPRVLWHPVFHAIALAVLSIAVYWRSVGNSWASDDLVQLFANPLVRDWHNIGTIFTQSVWAFNNVPCNYYRPLHMLLYAFIYWFYGYDPTPYHLVMVLAHAGVTALVYLLARRILGDWRAALLAGLAFAIHPIHSEAVMWVASVPDLFMTLHLLAGLYLFVSAAGRPGRLRTAGIAAFYAAALLTKETGVVLLPLLAAYELLAQRRRWRDLRGNLVLYAALVAVFGIYLAMRYHALGGHLAPAQGFFWHLSPAQFFFTAVWLGGKYLWKLVAPLGLNYWHEFHPIDGFSLLWAAALAAWLLLAAGVIAWRKRLPVVSFSLVAIALPLLPALNIVGIGANAFAERYLYLPSIGFVLLLGLLASKIIPILPRKALWGGCVAVLLLLAAASAQLLARARDWHDDFSLLQSAAKYSPRSAHIRKNLGFWLYEGGRYEAAIAEFRAALACPLDPEVAPGMLHYNLALALNATGRLEEAEVEARRALKEAPNYTEARVLLGAIARGKNDLQTAEAEFREALRVAPRSCDALNALGLLEFNRGNKQVAEELYRRAVKIDGTHGEARNNLAAVLVDAERYDEAINELHALLDVRPNYKERYIVYYNLGIAYRALGRGGEAVGWFNRALEARPDFVEARKALTEINTDARKGARPVL